MNTVQTLAEQMRAAQILHPIEKRYVCRQNFLIVENNLFTYADKYEYVCVVGWPNPNNWSLQ